VGKRVLKKRALKKSGSKKRLRIKKRTTVFKSKIFWIFVFLFLLLAGLFYLLFLSEIFEIKELNISGNEEMGTQHLLEIIEPEIQQSLSFRGKTFLKTKNIFLINSSKLEKTILERFLKIDTIAFKRKLPGTFILDIKERELFAVVCQLENQCFAVDKKGVVFQEEEVKNGLLVSFLEEEKIILGKEIIKPEYLEAIFQVNKNFKDSPDIDIKKLVFFDQRLNVETEQGFEIHFNLEGKIEDQLFNLDLVLRQKVSKEEFKNLKYIDLRFGNKVYYR